VVKVFTEAGEAVDGVLAFAVEDGLENYYTIRPY